MLFRSVSQSRYQNTLRYVDIGSKDFNELRAAIDRVGTSLSVAANQARKFGPALPPGFTETGVKPGTFKSSPVSGALNIPGSPKALAEARKRRGEALSNAIIGGAFPLLFGQGAGAAIGGGLGGAAGGMMGGQFGFGLSLVGTAVGQAFDTFTKAAIDTGKSLNDPIKNFQKLAEAGLLAGRSQQKYIEQLIEAGRVTEAAAAVQDEIIKKIGVSGLKDLQNAGAASDKLNKAIAELAIQMQSAVAGPLASFLSWLASVVQIGNNARRAEAAATNLVPTDPAARKKFEAALIQQYNAAYGTNFTSLSRGSIEATLKYMSMDTRGRTGLTALQQQFPSAGRPGVNVDITAQNQAQAQTRELKAQVDLEAKKLSLVGMSLEKNGQAYVNATKAVALQEYENKLLEIKDSWIGKAFDAERNQTMIRLANLQYAGKLKAIDAERLKTGRDQLEIQKALLSLQTELIQATLAAGDIDVQYAQLNKGEQAAIQEELQQLQTRLELEKRILDFKLQQQLLTKDLTGAERSLLQAIYKEQVKNLVEQTRLRKDSLLQAEAQLLVDKANAEARAIQQGQQPFEDLRAQRELELRYGKT